MNRKNKCKLLAYTVAAALTITASPPSDMTASAKTKSNVSTKWYTISKKPGTYQKKSHLKGNCQKGQPGLLHHQRNFPSEEEAFRWKIKKDYHYKNHEALPLCGLQGNKGDCKAVKK